LFTAVLLALLKESGSFRGANKVCSVKAGRCNLPNMHLNPAMAIAHIKRMLFERRA